MLWRYDLNLKGAREVSSFFCVQNVAFWLFNEAGIQESAKGRNRAHAVLLSHFDLGKG